MSNTHNITARVNPIQNPKGPTQAMASVTIDGSIAINNLTVVEGKNGLFIGYPQTKDKDGNFNDLIDFQKDKETGKLTSEAVTLKKEISDVVLGLYKEGQRKTPDIEVTPKDYEIKAYITPLPKSETATKGIGTIQVGELMRINSVRVNENKDTKKLFVAFSSYKDKQGDYRNIIHPVTKDMQEKVSTAVLSNYDGQLNWQKHMAKKEQNKEIQAEKQGPQKNVRDDDLPF